MRVLHLTLSAARGGRRDAILTLIDHLRPLGVECGLMALRHPTVEQADLASRVDYYDALEFQGRPTVRELVQVARICRDRKVDLIHAHDGGSQFVASALRCVSPSLRAVMTFHRTLGIESEGWRNRLRNAVSLPLIQRILTASEERKRYFLSTTAVAHEKVLVIPHGVDLRQFAPNPCNREVVRAELGIAEGTALILAIGHFGPEKGIDQVIAGLARAIPLLGDQPWHLAVLGTGAPDRVSLIQTMGRERLGAHVTFLGFREDVPRWLQGADLVIHAPRMEAFGLAVIQAMACGVPVIATAVGGIPEMVVDGETGLLVPSGDLEALGSAIASLARDPARREAAGAGALARARRLYDARRTAEQHLQLYDGLLARREASRDGTPREQPSHP